ncbi:MAG TPA: hypothetical protein VLH17_14115 [Candidatus Binatia bacterium]|jgi:hypothetical protein|nr:hypothetical protein [Candidatus Binatia bacterium]
MDPDLASGRKPQLRDTGIRNGKTETGCQYMNGGLVFDEQKTMEQRSASYNLKLVFAPRSGTAMSPVLLVIGDNESRRVEKFLLRAPWFYIRLPSGGYTIMARIENTIIVITDVQIRIGSRATYFLTTDGLKSANYR